MVGHADQMVRDTVHSALLHVSSIHPAAATTHTQGALVPPPVAETHAAKGDPRITTLAYYTQRAKTHRALQCFVSHETGLSLSEGN